MSLTQIYDMSLPSRVIKSHSFISCDISSIVCTTNNNLYYLCVLLDVSLSGQGLLCVKKQCSITDSGHSETNPNPGKGVGLMGMLPPH